ncbi:hypothetical protein JOD57_004639 [Geodermatophilus bullaregiensis]|uniref:hypothetical protein n=1 Tax=Geodermatophilus bullaregiensis TaxID=1564160 RepID=UPI001EF94CFD|nr:hypothetical protein [Geodermatophilus bullaregiensis]MBM7808802.1 hypothetical protein [Geodermatophilus bullaregiensis]
MSTRIGLVGAGFVAAVRGDGDDVRAPCAGVLRTPRLAVAVARAAADGGTVSL